MSKTQLGLKTDPQHSRHTAVVFRSRSTSTAWIRARARNRLRKCSERTNLPVFDCESTTLDENTMREFDLCSCVCSATRYRTRLKPALRIFTPVQNEDTYRRVSLNVSVVRKFSGPTRNHKSMQALRQKYHRSRPYRHREISTIPWNLAQHIHATILNLNIYTITICDLYVVER